MRQRGIFGPYTTATDIDVDKEALHASDPLVEPASTNLSTFSSNGGKMIFFHGNSDPWFSPLDTLGYYQSLAAANGGADKLAEWSRMFLVPGMATLRRRPGTRPFRHVERGREMGREGTAPDSVIATGQAFPAEAARYVPIPNTPSTQGAETAKMRTTFDAVRVRLARRHASISAAKLLKKVQVHVQFSLRAVSFPAIGFLWLYLPYLLRLNRNRPLPASFSWISKTRKGR